MNEFDTARRRYCPETVRYVLVAEAPPNRESGRFFYFENVPTGDSLFLETMKALYSEARGDVKQIRARKRSLLQRFRDDGFYLLDACSEPMPSKRRTDKLRCLRGSFGQLLVGLNEIESAGMKVVLISATVYEVCCEPLRRAGWNVINTEKIDFPGSGRQQEFQIKFRRVLKAYGWEDTR